MSSGLVRPAFARAVPETRAQRLAELEARANELAAERQRRQFESDKVEAERQLARIGETLDGAA